MTISIMAISNFPSCQYALPIYTFYHTILIPFVAAILEREREGRGEKELIYPTT